MTNETNTVEAQAEGQDFSGMGLRPELLAAIDALGWTQATPIQLQAIPAVLNGSDIVGVAQTGTGKTAAFGLPLLQLLADKEPAKPMNPYCVIIAPTRELVQQIGDQLTQLASGLKLRVITAYGGTSDRRQSTALAEGVEIVVGAPGRLLDLAGQGYLQYAQLTHCVLDEADRMFDMGFIDDIRSLLNRMPSRRQTLMFSATMEKQVKQLADDYLYHPVEIRVGSVAPPEGLSHRLVAVSSEQGKYDALVRLLKGDSERILVFCKTKKGAGDLARDLARIANENVQAIHADRTQQERERALQMFKDNQLRILVATNVASRGLDIDDVDLVVNFDVPSDPEDYVHRIGRTARAKKAGLAVTLVTPADERYIRRIEGFISARIDREAGAEAPGPGAPDGGRDRSRSGPRSAGSRPGSRGGRGRSRRSGGSKPPAKR